jgi:hypothetical protein
LRQLQTAAKYKPLHKQPQNALPAPIPTFGFNRREMITTLKIPAAKNFKRRFYPPQLANTTAIIFSICCSVFS